MKKILLLVGLFYFSCSWVSDYDRAKVVLALTNHSYYPISSKEANELSLDISKIKAIDQNAGLVPYKSLKSLKNAKQVERPLQYPVIFSSENGKIYAAKVFDFSLAYEVGLKSGCEIVKVDGKNILEMVDAAKSIEHLMKTGKSFVCQYMCGSSNLGSVQIRKELPYFPFVWSMPIFKDTAYVRINTFSHLSASYIKNNITNLYRSGKKKLIIDLRSISGGDYEEAASFLNLFVEKGTILFETKSDKQGYAKSFLARNDSPFSDFKLVVLINSNTASLGEISAAVLKEKTGAFLVGEKTAGKFFITKIFKVGPKKGLRITVAKLVLPGKELNDGINPDISVNDYTPSGDYIFTLPFFIDNDRVLVSALEHLAKTN